jgi:lipopolysaccharide transport system ATP-binding protein
MSDIAIRCEGLGKQYRIGERERYKALRDTITDTISAPFRWLRNPQSAIRNPQSEPFWALRDVSFNVKHGEVVGIIGRNGAGKSTLLKILSRITTPTEGQVKINGRVGSLLEVGTGFHPELTGRENISLNGAILGMRRREIERKFDEIVEFAEIEDFIDTPVKRYSSGMYMRLAFAVAAHLDPEILVVDEVLAVGDAQFQKKCLGKMGEVAQRGRTVLFVSHNMAAVQRLCSEAIWLEKGMIEEAGEVGEVVSRYLKHSFSTMAEQHWDDIATAPGNEEVRLRKVSVRPEKGLPSDPITIRTSFIMEFEYWNLQPASRLNLSLHVYTEDGVMAFNAAPIHEQKWHGRPFPVGLFRSVCRISGDLLNNGMHRVELLVVKDEGNVIYRHDEALVFDVRDSMEMRGNWHGRWAGAFRPLTEWSTELLSSAPLS